MCRVRWEKMPILAGKYRHRYRGATQSRTGLNGFANTVRTRCVYTKHIVLIPYCPRARKLHDIAPPCCKKVCRAFDCGQVWTECCRHPALHRSPIFLRGAALLGKACAELVGRCVDRAVKLSIQHSCFDDFQRGHKLFLTSNLNCKFALCQFK